MKSKKTNKAMKLTRSSIVQAEPAQLPNGYVDLLEDLKIRIQTARVQAAVSVNQELLLLYYSIGLELHLRFRKEAWGTSIIDQLAKDLRLAFPDMEGFSSRNLRRMRAFYRAYPLDPKSIKKWPHAVAKLSLVKWPPPVAKLPWSHNVILLEKCKDVKEREWYAKAAIEYGWSRSILTLQIEAKLYARQSKATTNFDKTLPTPLSDLAKQALKDPYVFDFLTISSDAQERELEYGLIDHVRRFLLELGAGFAFVGQQVNLDIGGEDYYIDLLFYHLKLRCYVVVELKAGPFKPEYTGKMNFYLSAVDDLMRHPDDNPTIGLILCKEKNKITAEYALRDMGKPMGVSEWKTKLVESLPKRLKGKLPTVEELKDELGK